MFDAVIQAIDATVKIVAPNIKIGLRPYLSLNGPKITMLTANIKKNIVSVIPTKNSLAPKYFPISGNAGKYISVESGGYIFINVIKPINPAVDKFFCLTK